MQLRTEQTASPVRPNYPTCETAASKTKLHRRRATPRSQVRPFVRVAENLGASQIILREAQKYSPLGCVIRMPVACLCLTTGTAPCPDIECDLCMCVNRRHERPAREGPLSARRSLTSPLHKNSPSLNLGKTGLPNPQTNEREALTDHHDSCERGSLPPSLAPSARLL